MRVILVDDDDIFRGIMRREVTKMGHEVEAFADLEAALTDMDRADTDVLLLDVRMPGIDGLAGLNRIRELTDPPEVIMLTGHGSIQDAIESMRRGASHYLTKPCRLDELELLLQRAGERRQLLRRHQHLVEHLKGAAIPMVVGESEGMHRAMRIVRKAAPTSEPVLIEGETGTGKELLARYIHHHSEVKDGPFVAVNCGSLSEGVLQSELFGHEKGAFTGANRLRQGLLELADGGTLFLDEAGEISPSVQIQLLRFLQSGELRRVGGNALIQVRVRIVAATNRELERAVGLGLFRRDLFYRLHTIHVRLPALGERAADIPLLVDYFLSHNEGRGRCARIDPEAMALLQAMRWPGNIRELRNIVTRLAILAEEEAISVSDVRSFLGHSWPSVDTDAPATSVTLKELERAHIVRVLRQFAGSKPDAARTLGIALKTLYNKIQAYEIDVDQVVEGRVPR